ncbi:hypothetical protein AXG93_3267s1090 [Marchantia polymorpha subsp. ruderalis]|uniref:Uncharacterized protein n=1 Tax=Marchantia polymorpha subsp. ruderalis TaxID=1480154 RepID=A0A176WPU1_MARPO|nr:hypothetical protein AXG93_3267s1090 [Marchantia polymorpha subsp. ruderalis]
MSAFDGRRLWRYASGEQLRQKTVKSRSNVHALDSRIPCTERLRECARSVGSHTANSLELLTRREKQEVLEGREKKCAGTCKKFDGQVHPAADGSAESAADRSARIPARANCGEARFPPMGMELGMSGDGTRVAAGEESTSARIPIAFGEMAATERVQFPLLSRSNPSRYLKDVEVDTDEDETPACTPPAQPRAEEEPRAARVPRKRKWDGEAEQS